MDIGSNCFASGIFKPAFLAISSGGLSNFGGFCASLAKPSTALFLKPSISFPASITFCAASRSPFLRASFIFFSLVCSRVLSGLYSPNFHMVLAIFGKLFVSQFVPSSTASFTTVLLNSRLASLKNFSIVAPASTSVEAIPSVILYMFSNMF